MQLPNSEEAEKSLIAAVLLDPGCIYDALDITHPRELYHPRHSRVFSAIYDIHSACQPINLVTLEQQLKANGTLDSVGGIATVAIDAGSLATSAAAKSYAKTIHDTYVARETHVRVSRILSQGIQDATLADAVMAAVAELSLSDRAGSYSAKELALRFEESLNTRAPVGIRTGFQRLDGITLGLPIGKMTIIGARPSNGKSAFTSAIACNQDLETPTDVYTVEDGIDGFSARAMANLSGVELGAIRRKQFTESERASLNEGLRAFYSMNISVCELTDRDRVLNEIRRNCHHRKTKLVIVDYIQLLADKEDNEQLTALSRSLKLMAKQLNVAMVVTSQLKRLQGDKPTLQDLRGSGSLEQDADLVLLLHRASKDSDNIELIVAKNKNGSADRIVDFTFDGAHMRFSERVRYAGYQQTGSFETRGEGSHGSGTRLDVLPA